MDAALAPLPDTAAVELYGETRVTSVRDCEQIDVDAGPRRATSAGLLQVVGDQKQPRARGAERRVVDLRMINVRLVRDGRVRGLRSTPSKRSVEVIDCLLDARVPIA